MKTNTDRMADLLRAFENEDLRATLRGITVAEDQEARDALHDKVRLKPDELGYWPDEGYAYEGGCNHYLVPKDRSGSCDYDVSGNKVTLNIHDEAGQPVLTSSFNL